MRMVTTIITTLVLICSLNHSASYAEEKGFEKPFTLEVNVSFADSSASFRPNSEASNILKAAPAASIIYISGRTSTKKYSEKDEILALKRALTARSYLIERGVSPLKIMINHASATDFITSNATKEGRYINQRVEIEMHFVPQKLVSGAGFQY